jgi:transposase, IS5 family
LRNFDIKQVQTFMAKAQKNRASKNSYVSSSQLLISDFILPFDGKLDSDNRWIILAKQIPWDSIVNIYQKQLNNKSKGASSINPRVVLGAIMIKHICDLSDRDTILQIQENVYMQYFLGLQSFSNEAIFDASLFVELRERLGVEQINEINEKVIIAQQQKQAIESDDDEPKQPVELDENLREGQIIIDATACPQDIAYPTDLNMLNDGRVKSEMIIDKLYCLIKSNLEEDDTIQKPRTYRQNARTDYLKLAQKKRKLKKQIRSGIRKQLNYLKRNITSILELLKYFEAIPLSRLEYKYLLVIQTMYDQQKFMFDTRTHKVNDRIVSIHQPHVRPIVRGKANAKVEFGSKIQVSLMNGIAFLDDLEWEPFNEGTRLMASVEKFKKRFGCYPKEICADKIYSTRENRKALKDLNIILRSKPLGRPKLAGDNLVRPGERNPIEGFFGTSKSAYGLNRIKARLQSTSESWIASIVLVFNLIKIIKLAFARSYYNALDFINSILQLLKNQFWGNWAT